MALRAKTIEYVFPTWTGNVLGNVIYEFPGQTFWIPETDGRSFSCAEVEVFSRDNHAAAQSISGVLVGIKLGTSGYLNNRTIDTFSSSAEDQTYLFNYDVTNYFASNFGTGVSNTGAVLVQFSGTSQNQANISAKIKLTYDYEDSNATTRIKTVRIPLESRRTQLTNAKVPINSGIGLVPLFNGYLPESGIVKRQVWLELFGNEASAVTNREQMLYLIDNGSGGPLGTGPSGIWCQRTSALNSSCWYKGIVDLTNSHAFTGTSTISIASTGVTTNFTNVGGLLCATYEYNHEDSTGIYNSIFLDGPVTYGYMGGTNANSGSTYSTEFYIQESGIQLKDSAILAYYNTPAAFTFYIGAGNQSGTYYPVVIGGLGCGQHSLVHRIDTSGNAGIGFGTLSRGRNVINSKCWAGTINNGNNLTSQILLNYISNKHASGDGTHNHSIYNNIIGFNPDVIDRAVINKTGAAPAAANYYLNSVQLYNPFITTALAMSAHSIQVFLTGTEGPHGIGSGWQNAYTSIWHGTVENQLCTRVPPMAPGVSYQKYHNYPNSLGRSYLDIANTRSWRIQNPDSVWSSLGQWTTYHTISYPLTGTITNSQSGNIELAIIDDLSDQILFTGGTVGNTDYNYVWYDNTRPIYVVAKENNASRAISVSQVVDSGGFDLSLQGGGSSSIVYTGGNVVANYIIPPCSVACLNGGRIFPNYYVGSSGPGVLRYKGIGVAGSGSMTSNATGELVFQIPKTLPTGAVVLNGYLQAPVNGGTGSYEILWSSISSGQDPASFNLFSEGTGSIGYQSSESGYLKSISIPLDADPSGISPGDVVSMRTVFLSNGWTIPQTSTWRFWIEYQQ